MGRRVLVYEAMRFEHFDQLPPHRRYVKDYHADAPLIGEQAAALAVPTLILTYLIPAPVTDADEQLFIDGVGRRATREKLVVTDDERRPLLPPIPAPAIAIRIAQRPAEVGRGRGRCRREIMASGRRG